MVFALNEWLQDIKRNQLPSILGGIGPMYSLVQLGESRLGDTRAYNSGGPTTLEGLKPGFIQGVESLECS